MQVAGVSATSVSVCAAFAIFNSSALTSAPSIKVFSHTLHFLCALTPSDVQVAGFSAMSVSAWSQALTTVPSSGTSTPLTVTSASPVFLTLTSVETSVKATLPFVTLISVPAAASAAFSAIVSPTTYVFLPSALNSATAAEESI